MPNFKLTEEVIEKITKYIRDGNFAVIAAQAVGVDESTYYRWLQRGKEIEGLYKEDDKFDDKDLASSAQLCFKLYKAIKECKSVAQINALKNIQTAGNDGHWQASAWFLERTDNKNWGKKQEITIADKIDKDKQDKLDDIFDDK